MRVREAGTPAIARGVRLGPALKFNLIDKIDRLDDERIVAVKHVSRAEEYLADHFPTFPVLPGVMMLEAITQAAGWLLHRRRRFSRSMVALKEARNVKYGRFVAPGDWLTVDVEWVRDAGDGEGGVFKAVGMVGVPPQPAVSARIELSYFDLGQKQPELGYFDERLSEHTKEQFALLQHGGSAIRV